MLWDILDLPEAVFVCMLDYQYFYKFTNDDIYILICTTPK